MPGTRYAYARFRDRSGAIAYTRPRIDESCDAVALAQRIAAISDAALYQLDDVYQLGGISTVPSGDTLRRDGATLYFGDAGNPITAIELYAIPDGLFLPDSTIDTALPAWLTFAGAFAFLGALRGGHRTEQAGR